MPSCIAPANPCHDVIQRRFLSPEVCLPPPIDPNSHRLSVEGRGEGCIEVKNGRPKASGRQFAQAASATTLSFALALAHAAGVNSLIWVILAAGKRMNKSFK